MTTKGSRNWTTTTSKVNLKYKFRIFFISLLTKIPYSVLNHKTFSICPILLLSQLMFLWWQACLHCNFLNSDHVRIFFFQCSNSEIQRSFIRQCALRQIKTLFSSLQSDLTMWIHFVLLLSFSFIYFTVLRTLWLLSGEKYSGHQVPWL